MSGFQFVRIHATWHFYKNRKKGMLFGKVELFWEFYENRGGPAVRQRRTGNRNNLFVLT